MRTPEEINCGMECIRSNASRTCIKPENGQCPRCEQLVSESLGRIQQLETERHQLLTKCERLERERDAAVRDLQKISFCEDCKHLGKSKKRNPCRECQENYKEKPNWQWRGVCPENTKEENR